jgi:hypothetical protein
MARGFLRPHVSHDDQQPPDIDDDEFDEWAA